MKEIKLTQGKVALVDNEDFDYLNQWKWRAEKDKYTYYARNDRMGYMHRIILKTPRNMITDHKDHNGLNNQKDNIRICNFSQNRMNTTAYSKSKYRGVYLYFHKDRIYISAQIRVNGKQLYLGIYNTLEEAALIYNKAAIKYHGEFANLNLI